MIPTPKQNLVLLRLAVLGEIPNKSAIRPALTVSERQDLTDAGYLELKREGRAEKAHLTEKAWGYLRNATELPLSKSQEASPVLTAFHARVSQFLANEDRSFVDLFTSWAAPAHSEKGERQVSIATAVRDSYLDLTGGRLGEEVRLRQLREELPNTDRASLDYCLLGMVMAGIAQIRQIDDSLAIDDRDRAASLEFGGSARHLFQLIP